MKNLSKFWLGLMVGVLVTTLLLPSSVFAGQAIKLVVNGTEIKCDVPPQNINGRVLVPARFVAEALGATVEWDGENQAVIVTSQAITTTDVKTSQTVNQSDIKETTYKGIKAIEKDGKIWFQTIDYSNKFQKHGAPYTPGYGFNKDSNTLMYVDYDKNETIIAIEADVITVYCGLSYINSKYYREP